MRPRDEPVAIRRCEGGHVSGVHGYEELAGFEGRRERGLEQRERGLHVPARTSQPAALEVYPRPRDPARPDRLRLLDQPLAFFEVSAKPLDAGELGQHFGATLRAFQGELGSEALLGRVEVVEIPQRPQAVGHTGTLEGSYAGSNA